MCRCTNNAAVELAVFRACFLALRTAVVRQFVERVWQFAPRFLSYNDVDENESKKAAVVSSCFLLSLDLENFVFRCLARHYPGYMYMPRRTYILSTYVSTRCYVFCCFFPSKTVFSSSRRGVPVALALLAWTLAAAAAAAAVEPSPLSGVEGSEDDIFVLVGRSCFYYFVALVFGCNAGLINLWLS